MAKTFGEYLKQLRLAVKPKKVSQQQLGDVINSTRQYIDAIEKSKGKTPPPRYQLLMKLANRLELTQSQIKRFLWMAFKERIHSNWGLYSFLHQNDVNFIQSNSFESSLVYGIKFVFNDSVSKDTQVNITQHFNTICKNYELISLTVTNKDVALVIGLSVNDVIGDIIGQLKTPDVEWNDYVQVQTIGNVPAEWSQFTISKKVATKAAKTV